MEFSNPGVIDGLTPFTPDTSVSFDYGSGLQNVDLIGDSWDSIFDSA